MPIVQTALLAWFDQAKPMTKDAANQATNADEARNGGVLHTPQVITASERCSAGIIMIITINHNHHNRSLSTTQTHTAILNVDKPFQASSPIIDISDEVNAPNQMHA
jgi:hypothetical protein